MTVTPANLTSINSFFDWILHTGDVTFFGYQGFMFLLILGVVFGLLLLFNANRFTVFGFTGITLIALTSLAYATFGWVAVLGAMLIGLMLGLAFIRLYGA